MDQLMDYLPFLIPLAAAELVLMVVALVHILKHDHYKMGNRVIWVIVSIVVGIIGPILYFTLGKADD